MLQVLFTITDKVESNAVPSLQNGRITHNWHWHTQVRGLLLYPHGSGLSAYIKPNVFYPGLAGTMTTIPQSPRHKHQSTHQQSLPALTTSSPLNQIRPGLEAASTQCSRFRKTHTCWHIFPHRMCLNFIFCVPVVIFHCIGDGAKSFNMFLKNIFLYDNSSV